MLEIVSFTLGPVATNCYLLADPETGEAAVIDPAWDGHVILAAAQERGWRIAHIWLTHAHFDHFGGAGGVANGCNPLPMVALHPADYPLWRAKGGAPLFGIPLDDPGPEPTIELCHGQVLRLGRYAFEVRHAPGHTPGHVMFYCADPRAERRERSDRSRGAGEGVSTAASLRSASARRDEREDSAVEVHVLSDAEAHVLSGVEAHVLSGVEAPGVLFSGDVIFRRSVGRTDLPGGDWDTLLRSIREQVLTLPDETRILPGHMGETTVGEERRMNPFLL